MSDPHRPRVHFTAPANWLNDPNGVCFHAGRWHLFYQLNAEAPRWGRIHWGHASSADLLDWRDEPVALAPTPGADAGGCFSGSFAVVAGLPTLYYTGYTPEAQVQCVATCADDAALQTWTKQPQRTITTPPEGVAPQDFRDPYVFQHGGVWWMVVGASLHGERGQCLLYRSADGHSWAERGPLFTAPELEMGRMWECPNFFPVGAHRWALTVSVWPNLGALWFVGRFEDERFVPEARGVLDPDGGAFAHLTMTAPDGRRLQWAWLNEQREQAALDAAGWAGALSVPREIGVDARGRLQQAPARELLALRGPEAAQGKRAFAGRCLDIEAHFTLHDARPAGLTLLSTPAGAETTRIVFKPEARRLTVERARSSLDAGTRRQDVHGFLALERGEALRLRVLVDHSVVEVFANERLVLSTRVYPTRDDSVHGAAWLDGAGEVALQAWPLRPTLPLRSPA